MPVLTREQKVFAVRALAEFRSPTEVAKAMKEHYGLDVPTAQIVVYDPTTHQGRKLGKEFKRIFEDYRKKYLDSEQNIGIANRTHRLDVLNEAARIARERGDIKGMVRASEAAARETGGHWSGQKAVQGGGPVIVFNAPTVPDGADAAPPPVIPQSNAEPGGQGDA